MDNRKDHSRNHSQFHAQQARNQRHSRLRKPANRDKFTRRLAVKLERCTAEKPCESSACVTCRSRQVDRFVNGALAYFAALGFSLKRSAGRNTFRDATGRELAYVTIIPLSRIAVGDLVDSEKTKKFVAKLQRVLRKAGVTWFIFVLDASTHEHESGKFEPYYKIHAHGFLLRDELNRAIRVVRAAFPNKGNVKVGVKVQRYNGNPAAIRYMLKEPATRSITLERPLKNRNWKKQNRLRSAQCVEILRWMDQVGLCGRLMIQGLGTHQIANC